MKRQERTKLIVVTILFLVAVGTVVYSFAGGRFRRRGASPVSKGMWGSSSDLPPAPTASAPAPAPTPAATPAANAAPGGADTASATNSIVPIDLAAVRAQFPNWIAGPQRDPFHTVVPAAPRQEGPRAVDLLSVRGIWRQSGGRFAVLNNTVLTEGENIASFRVEKIEASAVWVRGSNGLEQLTFQVGAPPPPPPERNPPPGRRIPGGGTTRDRRLSP